MLILGGLIGASAVFFVRAVGASAVLEFFFGVSAVLGKVARRKRRYYGSGEGSIRLYRFSLRTRSDVDW